MMELLNINKSLEDTCLKAVKTFNNQQQFDQAKEELAELIVAISHYQRKRIDRTPIFQEIVDVYIMLTQLRLILNNDNLFQEIYRKKMFRFETFMNEYEKGEK